MMLLHRKMRWVVLGSEELMRACMASPRECRPIKRYDADLSRQRHTEPDVYKAAGPARLGEGPCLNRTIGHGVQAVARGREPCPAQGLMLPRAGM